MGLEGIPYNLVIIAEIKMAAFQWKLELVLIVDCVPDSNKISQATPSIFHLRVEPNNTSMSPWMVGNLKVNKCQVIE